MGRSGKPPSFAWAPLDNWRSLDIVVSGAAALIYRILPPQPGTQVALPQAEVS